ncbi:hypothetical protein B0H19DRAFT_1273832 [Mycena capillaripes]|nr:hypothetical protein B0H19DRAFT_1273832 [Mycena capillaripes]
MTVKNKSRNIPTSLLAKDRNDPRRQTDLRPGVHAKERDLGVLNLIGWNKDVIRKDYVGEAGVAAEDWCDLEAGLHFQIASIVRVLCLSQDVRIRRLQAGYAFLLRSLDILFFFFSPSLLSGFFLFAVYTDVVPSHPARTTVALSCLTGTFARCPRRPSPYEAYPPVLDAPHTENLTHYIRGTSPWTPYPANIFNTRSTTRSRRCRSSTCVLPSLIGGCNNDLQRSYDPQHSRLECAIPPPCPAPYASIPSRIRCFPRLPPATTISGTALLSPSTPAPLAQTQLPPPLACAAHPPRGQHLLPPFHVAVIALTAARRTTTAFSRFPPPPSGACAWAHPPRCTLPPACPAARHGRSSSQVCHLLPPRSLRRHPILSLRRQKQPQRRLQYLQHQLPIAGLASVASPRAATLLAVF